jgi:hypothetical protein
MSITTTPGGHRWDSVAAQRELFAAGGLPGGSSALIRNDHHKNQLLDALMHYMPMEVRHKVACEVPAAYNAYFANEQMVVDRIKSSDKVALDGIAAAMSGAEWSPDAMQTVANLVRESGRDVEDVA